MYAPAQFGRNTVPPTPGLSGRLLMRRRHLNVRLGEQAKDGSWTHCVPRPGTPLAPAHVSCNRHNRPIGDSD